MRNKITISALGIVTLTIIFSGVFLHQQAREAPKNDKCGDGVCGELELLNPNICPQDCEANQDNIPPRQSKCGDGVCGEVEKANPNLCPEDCENISDNLVAFIAIHMETGGTPKILDYQEKTWPTLVELIKLADKYDFKLTLEFNPQWAFYILADESRLKLLRNWEQNNHEIALHHHGPSHEDWNGYSNIEAKKKDPRYIGTISEMMSIMEQLSVSGKILSGGITNENTDWPKGIIYDTDGGELKTDLLSKPKNITFNNFPVLQLRYRQYATISSKSASLVEIKESYSNNEDAIMGIVFHAHDYNRTSQNQSDIKKLFASLSENNIEIKTVKDILSE